MTLVVPTLQSFTLDYNDSENPLELAVNGTETINVLAEPYNAPMLPSDFTGAFSEEGFASFTINSDFSYGYITDIEVTGIAEKTGLTFTLTNNEDSSISSTAYINVVP